MPPGLQLGRRHRTVGVGLAGERPTWAAVAAQCVGVVAACSQRGAVRTGERAAEVAGRLGALVGGILNVE